VTDQVKLDQLAFDQQAGRPDRRACRRLLEIFLSDFVEVVEVREIAQEYLRLGVSPSNARREHQDLRRDRRALTMHPFVTVVQRGHPWVARKRISLADLVDAPFLALLRGYHVRETLDATLKKHDLWAK